MQSLDALPNFPLQPGDGVTAPFLALGMRDFHAAAHYVYQLPFTPEQIGSYKVALHQRFLQAWLARAAVAGGYTVADFGASVRHVLPP
jgi:hypothetical protein